MGAAEEDGAADGKEDGAAVGVDDGDRDGTLKRVGHVPMGEGRHGMLKKIRCTPGAVVNAWRNAHLIGGNANVEEGSGA